MERNPRPEFPLLHLEDVPMQRRILCADYEACLQTAVNKNWPGFTCNECTAFRKASATVLYEEHDALLELCSAIVDGPRGIYGRDDLRADRYPKKWRAYMANRVAARAGQR